jgi:hypothetical protein
MLTKIKSPKRDCHRTIVVIVTPWLFVLIVLIVMPILIVLMVMLVLIAS